MAESPSKFICNINYLIWSEWRDSNPRPLVPQTSALTGLRYTPTPALIEKALVGRNAPRVAGRSQGRIAPAATAKGSSMTRRLSSLGACFAFGLFSSIA
jgi:hypothetical protein